MDKEKLNKDNEYVMKEILHKNFPSVVCSHCNEVVNISLSNDFRRLVSRNRTLSEISKTLRGNWYRWMNIKNGQIEALHKMMTQIIQLVPEEQLGKMRGITQEMRDEIKYVEKRRRG